MADKAQVASGRALALARRKAMSNGGKTAVVRPSGRQAQVSAPSSARPAPAKASASRNRPPAAAPMQEPAATAQDSVGRASAARAGGKAVGASVARQASRARRQALSSQGKRALGPLSAQAGQRTRGARDALARAGRNTAGPSSAPVQDCGCGCGGSAAPQETARESQPRERVQPVQERPRNRRNKRPALVQSTAKAAALARRKALSARGKAGLGSSGLSQAQTARASNPQLSSRELAKTLREQRSRQGGGGQKKSAPCGKRRKSQDKVQAGAQDASWKVGASQTSQGQRVSGTQLGRDQAVTGNEAGSCRSVTGTEYLAADIFREFCHTDLPASPQRVSRTSTALGSSVTGIEVGRSDKVTGNEPGSCKRVTGSEYLSAEQMQGFCGVAPEPGPARGSASQTRRQQRVTGSSPDRMARVTGAESGSDRELTGSQYTNVSEVSEGDRPAPGKVGQSSTLRGGRVSGTRLGRRERMTGDEPGSCQQVTGDEYLSAEQFSQFCDASPQPQGRKVGRSRTLGGEDITGSLTGRSLKITGDEPGTCKAITGTPYVGAEQYNTYCEAPEAAAAVSRAAPSKRQFGKPLTGQQPALAGKISGDARGACAPVSGTAYVGADQAVAACPSLSAEDISPDFPQPLTLAMAASRARSKAAPQDLAQEQTPPSSRITGASRVMQGQITGPFDKADGRVTGTEEARFGRNPAQGPALPPVEGAVLAEIDGRIKSRITGEGMDAGVKITGDDWDRGERVTGTEGASAMRRNPSLRGGPMQPMAARAAQPQEAAEPISKVTGSSGNTSKGALITYSGGARG